MVKSIIVSGRRSLDMLAWSERTDNGRQKTEIMVMTSLWAESCYWLLRRSPSQTCHAKPKTQINRRRTLPASFPLVGCLPQAAWPEDYSPKSQDAVALQQLRRGALPMIDRIDIRQAIDRCSNIRLYCQALVMVSSSKADSLIAKIQRSRRNGQRDWCMSRVTAIISALVICIIVCLSWAVNHYRDNAITYKAQRDKNARELKLANAAVRHADASAWCCCARCKIHEGVSWC